MKYVGVDLHKHSIVLCVVVLAAGRPKVVERARFRCDGSEAIRAFFQELGPFQVVVEATAAYEWFFLLIEDLADRLVLAHPKKLRVIAESTRKSDKIDAQVLGVFLALDMIPQAYRPTPRIRQHRVLVRHRCWLQRRITSLKCKVRNVLGHYNADIAGLFTRQGDEHLAAVPLAEGGDGLCRAGPGLPPQRGKMPGAAHQQGGLAVAALGDDPGRLAAGRAFAPLATDVRGAARQHWVEEEGHCGRGASPAVHDVCDAPGGPALRTAGRAQRQSAIPAAGKGLGSGSTEGGPPLSAFAVASASALRGGVKVDATAKAEGARGKAIPETPRRPYSTRSGVGPSSDPVLCP